MKLSFPSPDRILWSLLTLTSVAFSVGTTVNLYLSSRFRSASRTASDLLRPSLVTSSGSRRCDGLNTESSFLCSLQEWPTFQTQIWADLVIPVREGRVEERTEMERAFFVSGDIPPLSWLPTHPVLIIYFSECLHYLVQNLGGEVAAAKLGVVSPIRRYRTTGTTSTTPSTGTSPSSTCTLSARPTPASSGRSASPRPWSPRRWAAPSGSASDAASSPSSRSPTGWPSQSSTQVIRLVKYIPLKMLFFSLNFPR